MMSKLMSAIEPISRFFSRGTSRPQRYLIAVDASIAAQIAGVTGKEVFDAGA